MFSIGTLANKIKYTNTKITIKLRSIERKNVKNRASSLFAFDTIVNFPLPSVYYEVAKICRRKINNFRSAWLFLLASTLQNIRQKKKRLTKNRRKTVRKKNTDENDIFLCEHFRVSWHFFSCRSNIRHKSMAFQPIEINSTSNKNTIYLLFIIKVLFSSSQCCYSFELKKIKNRREMTKTQHK